MTDEFTFREYVLAGSAIFTIESLKTKTRFIYRVRCQWEGVYTLSCLHFVGVLTTSHSTNDYQFLGTIFDETRYRHGKRSNILPNSPEAMAFRWLWRNIDRLSAIRGVHFYKSEYCGRCGRLLTDLQSIEAGIGPECTATVDPEHRGGHHDPAPSR